MPVSVYTEDQFFERAVSVLSTNHPGRATHPLSFLGQEARACAQLLSEIQKSIADADRDGVPAVERVNGVIQSRCSSERLDQWAEFFGLESNRGAGLFGRNAQTAAVGGAATARGVNGTVVPINSQLTDPSGKVVLRLVQGVTLGAFGVNVVLAAVTPGAAGNLPVNTKLTWQSPPVGLTATTVLTEPLTKGAERESDLDLVLRLLAHMQAPPKGGTANDYRTWSLAATDTDGSSLGINEAYIFPRRNGDGSLDVVATVPGYGATRDPGAVILGKLLTYLNSRKIATDTVRVFGPRFVTGEAILITIYRAVPASPAYRWHWDDSAGSLTTFGDTTTTSMVVTGATLPASLKAAVNAGAKPMLQILVPTYSPVPLVPRVIAYAENTPAGKSTLTLEAVPLTTIPTVSSVYAGSAAVVPVCTAVALYANQLGPSIQSGFQDPARIWESKLTVGRVAQSLIDARDSDGSQPIVYSLNVGRGTSDGIVLRYSGSNSLADYDLFDNTPATAPQFALLSGVILRA